MTTYRATVSLSGAGVNSTAGVFNVLDYGAAGDGTTDDYTAIVDTITAAKASGGHVHFPTGYRFAFETTIDLSDVIIKGNGATLVKNFDGIGLDITGGILYTEIDDLTVEAGTGYKATDYASGDTSHGIRVTGTRTRFRRVDSYYHEGAGFYFDNTSGNMNKSVFEDIYGVACSLAGIYMTGNYDEAAGTGTNDMSIWDMWGRTFGTFGHGVYVTDSCPIRQSVLQIYAESNGLGASFPATEYGMHLGLSRFNTIWAYAEQGGGSPSSNEVYVGPLSHDNVITSSRVNVDKDASVDHVAVTNIVESSGTYTVTTSPAHEFVSGQSVFFENIVGMVELNGNSYTIQSTPTTSTFTITDTAGHTAYSSGGLVNVDGRNKWIYGSRLYAPAQRQNTPMELYNANARVGTSGEYTQARLVGNGGVFGFLRGVGDAGGAQKIGLVSHDGSNQLYVDENGVILKSLRGIYVGSGTPEGTVSAFPGSLYLNTSGGAGVSFYVKESGSGTNTGWVAK